MTIVEIIVTLASCVGLAELIKFLVAKRFSKKRDQVMTQKDEFSALRERIDYNEKEINRLNRSQISANRKISKMYSFLIDITKQTCSEENCALRKVVAINFDEFEDDDEKEPIVVEEPTIPKIPRMPRGIPKPMDVEDDGDYAE
jgi:hypothetical protein